MKQETKTWLQKAEDDFDTAKFNINAGKKEGGVFFLQQTVEKALKALIIKQSGQLLKSHDLLLLAKRANAPSKIQQYCKELSPAYQYTRYPDVPFDEDLNSLSSQFIKYTEEILKWVKKNL